MSSELAEPGDKIIVLDANILIRAILGTRVLSLLRQYAGQVRFLSPEHAFEDARTYLPEILAKRGLPQEATQTALAALDRLKLLVISVPRETYAGFEAQARRRLRGRDEEDWPFLALSLKLGCPIWTEDADFFGSGVPTWTTDRVELYFRERWDPR